MLEPVAGLAGWTPDTHVYGQDQGWVHCTLASVGQQQQGSPHMRP